MPADLGPAEGSTYISCCGQRGITSSREADLKTPLPKRLTLPDPETLIQLAECGYKSNLEGRQALEHTIATRRGGVWLELTEAHYQN